MYLLAAHEDDDQFKTRTIDRINAFNCPSSLPNRASKARLCFYLHVAPVEVAPSEGSGGKENRRRNHASYPKWMILLGVEDFALRSRPLVDLLLGIRPFT